MAFGIFERGSRELQVVRREPGAHPSVAALGAELEASLSALVDSALEPFDVSPQDRAVARAMIDLNTWEALRSAGLDAPSAVTAASRMLAAVSSSNAGATPP